MREIKFRGWTGKEMHYGWGCLTNESNKRFIVIDENDYYPDPVTLMQFTSLRDKNGKEIYEGDIVSVPAKYFRVLRFDAKCEADYVCSVWHDDELAQFNIGNITMNVIPRKDLAVRYYEVVGNVFESSHLLNRTEQSK